EDVAVDVEGDVGEEAPGREVDEAGGDDPDQEVARGPAGGLDDAHRQAGERRGHPRAVVPAVEADEGPPVHQAVEEVVIDLKAEVRDREGEERRAALGEGDPLEVDRGDEGDDVDDEEVEVAAELEAVLPGIEGHVPDPAAPEGALEGEAGGGRDDRQADEGAGDHG